VHLVIIRDENVEELKCKFIELGLTYLEMTLRIGNVYTIESIWLNFFSYSHATNLNEMYTTGR